jgi:hypothetical protein
MATMAQLPVFNFNSTQYWEKQSVLYLESSETASFHVHVLNLNGLLAFLNRHPNSCARIKKLTAAIGAFRVNVEYEGEPLDHTMIEILNTI